MLEMNRDAKFLAATLYLKSSLCFWSVCLSSGPPSPVSHMHFSGVRFSKSMFVKHFTTCEGKCCIASCHMQTSFVLLSLFFLCFKLVAVDLWCLGGARRAACWASPSGLGRSVPVGMQRSGFSNTMLRAAMCVCKEPTGCSSRRDARLIWQPDWFCQVTVWELSPASNPLPYPLEELGWGGGRREEGRGSSLGTLCHYWHGSILWLSAAG